MERNIGEDGYFGPQQMSTSNIPDEMNGLPKAVLFVFCAFLLVGLNVIIDPQAMDVSLIPRLLALLVFLAFTVAVVAWTDLGARLDFTVLRDPLVMCYGAYTLVTALSLFFAVNPTAGFTEVAKTLGTYVVLCLACLLLPLQRRWPTWLVKFALAAAVLGLAAGLWDWTQHLGWGVFPRPQMLAVMGLMSNVNLYASFLLLLLPLCAAAAAMLAGGWRWLALVLCVGLVVMILLLQTRAVYLGLLVATITGVAALLASRHRGGPSAGTLRTYVPLALLLCLILVAVLALTPAAQPLIERGRSIFSEQSMTAAGGRPVIWLASLGMIQDHLWSGVGAGNFPVMLHDYFDTDDPEFSVVHPNWLQPHNDFLWVFAEKGLFGMVFFLAVWALAARHLLRGLRSGGLGRDQTYLAVAAWAGLAGFAVVSFFDFPLERVNHQVYFAFYLAVAVLLNHREARPPTTFFRHRALLSGVSLIVMVLLGFGISYSVAALRQERIILLSRLAFLDENWKDTAHHAQQAATPWKNLDPFATPVVFLEGMGHLMLAEHREALTCFERAQTQMPSRAYIPNSVGLTHTFLRDYDKAMACFSGVLERSPGNAGVLHSLAWVHLQAGDWRKAREFLGQIPPEQWSEAAEATSLRIDRQSKKLP